MKKILIILIGILFFCSCKKDKVTGLSLDVRYVGGASGTELEDVRIALHRIDGITGEKSKWIDKTGKQLIPLDVGPWILELDGNRCKVLEWKYLSDRITIKTDEILERIVSIERLPYSFVISRNGIEIPEGDTITMGYADVFNIWNKYSSNELTWEINAYPQPSWITFNKNIGTLEGNGSEPIIFSIEKDKMKDGYNYSDIILIAKNDIEGKGFKIIIRVVKEIEVPRQALLSGKFQNDCPDTTVMLSAKSEGANSFKWYKYDNTSTPIHIANSDIYEVKETGIYYATGVNAAGTEGPKSKDHHVTIITCNQSHPDYVVLPSVGILVQKTDASNDAINWTNAVTACLASPTGGLIGWRLPTLSELAVIIDQKEFIGGFKTGSYANGFPHYWSQTSDDADKYYLINSTNGEPYLDILSATYHTYSYYPPGGTGTSLIKRNYYYCRCVCDIP